MEVCLPKMNMRTFGSKFLSNGKSAFVHQPPIPCSRDRDTGSKHTDAIRTRQTSGAIGHAQASVVESLDCHERAYTGWAWRGAIITSDEADLLCGVELRNETGGFSCRFSPS